MRWAKTCLDTCRRPGEKRGIAGDETVAMRESELWIFDNKIRHSAHNPSLEPRIHLILDLLPDRGSGFLAYTLADNRKDA